MCKELVYADTPQTRRNWQDFMYHTTGRRPQYPEPNSVVSRVVKSVRRVAGDSAKCPVCQGEGRFGKEECLRCHGTGRVNYKTPEWAKRGCTDGR
ncbi:MAG: hypothetical protein WC455_13245 [Dehalococcoidia bacterium]